MSSQHFAVMLVITVDEKGVAGYFNEQQTSISGRRGGFIQHLRRMKGGQTGGEWSGQLCSAAQLEACTCRRRGRTTCAAGIAMDPTELYLVYNNITVSPLCNAEGLWPKQTLFSHPPARPSLFDSILLAAFCTSDP